MMRMITLKDKAKSNKRIKDGGQSNDDDDSDVYNDDLMDINFHERNSDQQDSDFSDGSEQQEANLNLRALSSLVNNNRASSKTLEKQINGVQSLSNLEKVQKVKMGLKACKGESGFFNPMKAFDCLNAIQKKEDPKAYESDVLVQMNKKRQREQELKD